jgi:hypothetical protein
LAMGLNFSADADVDGKGAAGTGAAGTGAATALTPTTSFYPSTNRGPIDTSSSRRAFPWWNQSTLRVAITASVSFLEAAMCGNWNRTDCEDVVKSLAEDLGITEDRAKRRAMVKSLRAHYGKHVVRKSLWSRKK